MIGKTVAAALVTLAVLLGVAALVAALIASLNPFNTSGATPGAGAAPDGTAGPSPNALADIPANYLALYQDAARVCPGLHWSILAGIGKVESDHGRSNAPGVHSGQNSAGAKVISRSLGAVRHVRIWRDTPRAGEVSARCEARRSSVWVHGDPVSSRASGLAVRRQGVRGSWSMRLCAAGRGVRVPSRAARFGSVINTERL